MYIFSDERKDKWDKYNNACYKGSYENIAGLGGSGCCTISSAVTFYTYLGTIKLLKKFQYALVY